MAAQNDESKRPGFIVTTGTVPSREIPAATLEEAAKLADKTNGSYRRDW